MKIMTEVVGYMAAAVGTSILLPQVYKSIKTKKVNDISMSMLVVYIINLVLWEIYGLLLFSIPLIVCNVTSLIIALFQIILKIKYTQKT
jgi:MtN3 and saliva related transmembrane protein